VRPSKVSDAGGSQTESYARDFRENFVPTDHDGAGHFTICAALCCFRRPALS
jgi:hypothetical protein